MKCHVPLNVIRFLGWFSLIGLVGVVALVMADKMVPEGLMTIIATAAGALGAILSSTRNTSEHDDNETPLPVTVSNPASDPVQTEDVNSP